jgi:hypothetical protein
VFLQVMQFRLSVSASILSTRSSRERLCIFPASPMIVYRYTTQLVRENRDKIETYLAMGASRFEACKPIGKEALKLALLPTINQMR